MTDLLLACFLVGDLRAFAAATGLTRTEITDLSLACFLVGGERTFEAVVTGRTLKGLELTIGLTD